MKVWCTLFCRVMQNFSTILPDCPSILHKQPNNDRQIRLISPIPSSKRSTSKAFHDQSEMDSHDDTIVASRNCTVLHHTERSCDVAPFSDTYDPMKDVEIFSAAIGFTSVTVRQYILVFHKALYMPELDHTLINPNKLRQFHTQVQDNPDHATEPMNITNPSGDFIACLESQGKNIFPTPGFQIR